MLVLQLVLEVVQQLQRMFQPDIKQIKKRIEDLIQREFLVRCLSFCWWSRFCWMNETIKQTPAG